MATNPQVEKLQALAIRHGEKAVVTLAVVLFLLFVVKAVTREAPIDITPDNWAIVRSILRSRRRSRKIRNDVRRHARRAGGTEIRD